MNILALETSGNVCGAAVLRDDRILSESYMDDQKTHSETIGPMLDEVLARVGMKISGIDFFACSVGPGSFTGIRIGTAMAKAFAHASGKPTVGVNSLDALAQNVRGIRETVCAIIDARRGEVYTALYQDGQRTSEYRAVPLDTLLAELKNKETVFVGDAAIKYADTIRAASDTFTAAHNGIALARAGSVGLAAYQIYQSGGAKTGYDLVPFYLRKTQAERVYAQKHGESTD